MNDLKHEHEHDETDDDAEHTRDKFEAVADIAYSTAKVFFGPTAHVMLVVTYPVDGDDDAGHRIRTAFTMSREDTVSLLDGILRDLCERYGLTPNDMQLVHQRTNERACDER